jgi:hypothetical protein
MRRDEEAEAGEERSDAGLSAALQTELRAAPWYMSSAAIHAVLFLFLMLLPTPIKGTPRTSIIITGPDIVDPIETFVDASISPVEDPPDLPKTDTLESEPSVEMPDFDPDVTFSRAEGGKEDSATGKECNQALEGDPDAAGWAGMIGVGFRSGDGPNGKIGKGPPGYETRFGPKRPPVGVPPKLPRRIDGALKWLAEHQEPDGRWDCRKYGGGDQPFATHDVAVTSLALLAFLGDGNSTKFGKFKPQVQKAVQWLRSQEKNGCVGPHRYEAGIAMMAMAEAYGMSQDSDLRLVAQRCVDYAAKTQCPSGGWDYGPNSQRADTSVSGWWIMGLKSARVAGLNVPPETFARALAYVQKATKVSGDTSRLNASVSYATDKAPDVNAVTSGGGSNRLTAVALTCLQFLGRERGDGQVAACTQQVLQDGVPTATQTDFYRLYYASLGLFQMGVKSEPWKKWQKPLCETLLSTQVQAGTARENRGSWNHETDPWGSAWGRVGETALGALTLEVWWRYANVHESAGNRKPGAL